MTDSELTTPQQDAFPKSIGHSLLSLIAFFLLAATILVQDLSADRNSVNTSHSLWAFGVMGHIPGVGEAPGGEVSLRYGLLSGDRDHTAGLYARLVAGIAEGNAETFGSFGLAYSIARTGTTLEVGGVLGYFDGERFGAGGEGAMFQRIFDSSMELGGIARVLGESGGTEKQALIGVRFRF
jgi:hypothetical protein